MNVRVHCLGLALLLLLALSAGLSRVALAADLSLVDQGWQIVEQDGKRTIEVSAMVINESQASVEYEVRFIVERAEGMPGPAASSEAAQGEASQPAKPVWSEVRTASVHGGPLAPSSSDTVTGTFPHDVLAPGKAHRFRSELSEAVGGQAPTGPIVADAIVTSLGSPFAPMPRLGVFGLPPMSLPRADEARLPHLPTRDAVPTPGLSATSTIGFGTMDGLHWSHRQGGLWHEVGKGEIFMKERGWSMTLEYAYKATGPDAESLSAEWIPTLTGGTYWNPTQGMYLISFDTATATMQKAGLRHDLGNVRYSQGARAAGTFTATLTRTGNGTGDGPATMVWAGALSLFNGYMSLDLSAETAPAIGLGLYLPGGVGHQGKHTFKLKFTATQLSP